MRENPTYGILGRTVANVTMGAGLTGNSGALSRFLQEVERRWRKWLLRRNRERKLNWTPFRRILQRFPLLPVRTVHSVYRHAVNP